MDWRTGGVELFTALARQQIHNVNNTLAKTPVHDIIHSPPSGSGTVIEFQWSDPTLASTRCNGSPPVKSPSPGGTRCTQIHKYKQTNIRIQTHRYTNANTQIHKYAYMVQWFTSIQITVTGGTSCTFHLQIAANDADGRAYTEMNSRN